MDEIKYSKTVKKVTFIELIINILLALIKLIGGFLSSSSALISDGVDSFGDILTSFVAFFAGKKASKKADNDHQFGHKKIENLVSLIFGMIILFTSLILIYNSIIIIIDKKYLNNNYSFLLAIIISSIALLIKLSIFIYTFISSKSTNSPILKTQSIDHLLDSFSTLISLISLSIISIFSNYEYLKILDPIASILISIIMIIGSLKIIINNSKNLLDSSCSIEEEKEIYSIIYSNKKIDHIDVFRSRIVANYIYLEIEVTIKEEMSLKEAHDIIENIREEILIKIPSVKHCIIHVNPLIHEHIDEL